MDWLVFGDDWGAHPSTTQHLVRNLPDDDRVVWVDSIGMRSPQLRLRDISRVFDKARRMMDGARPPGESQEEKPRLLGHLKPKILPWHGRDLARRFNRTMLVKEVRQMLSELDMPRPYVLSSSPVPALYMEDIPHDKVGYLRLDDYSRLPGCDPGLVRETEQLMLSQADRVVATARKLLPSGSQSTRARYLPQGTDVKLFGQVPLDPPGTRVLGFFGLLAEWLDYDLIRRVAEAAPDWRLEFIGPMRLDREEAALQLPNVRVIPGVPLAKLPKLIKRWSAAWAPFELSELTEAVNPLKVREYLAAGLPTHCTPLPEVRPLRHVFRSRRPHDIVQWLRTEVAADTREQRLRRQRSVSRDSWGARTAELRKMMSDG